MTNIRFTGFIQARSLRGLLVGLLAGCSQDFKVDSNNGNPPPPEPLSLISRTQHFAVTPDDRQIDLLFVVDNSASMEGEQENLGLSFGNFISNFQSRSFNFHIGVVTTDVIFTNQNSSTPGASPWTDVAYADFPNVGPGSLLAYKNNDRFLSSSSANLIEQFTQNTRLGITGSGAEQALTSLIYALSPELSGPGKFNANFLRSDAFLSIIIVSDEDESLDSQDYLPTNPAEKERRLARFDERLMEIKNNRRGLVRVDSVVTPSSPNSPRPTPTSRPSDSLAVSSMSYSSSSSCNSPDMAGVTYEEVASKYGGTITNVCSDFSGTLATLGSSIAVQVQSQFALEKVPLANLKVLLNNRLLVRDTDFIYQESNNSIELKGAALATLQAGPATLVISYQHSPN